jgi:hypothetical protein
MAHKNEFTNGNALFINQDHVLIKDYFKSLQMLL